jgi:hypothetical protein
MDWQTGVEKRSAVREAEAAGTVADSMDVRMALMARVHSGEITLEDAQAQLKKIKAGAKRNGQTTRARAFRAG